MDKVALDQIEAALELLIDKIIIDICARNSVRSAKDEVSEQRRFISPEGAAAIENADNAPARYAWADGSCHDESEPPSEAEIEAAARAIFDDDAQYDRMKHIPQFVKEHHGAAKRALIAARKAREI